MAVRWRVSSSVSVSSHSRKRFTQFLPLKCSGRSLGSVSGIRRFATWRLVSWVTSMSKRTCSGSLSSFSSTPIRLPLAFNVPRTAFAPHFLLSIFFFSSFRRRLLYVQFLQLFSEESASSPHFQPLKIRYKLQVTFAKSFLLLIRQTIAFQVFR